MSDLPDRPSRPGSFSLPAAAQWSGAGPPGGGASGPAMQGQLQQQGPAAAVPWQSNMQATGGPAETYQLVDPSGVAVNVNEPYTRVPEEKHSHRGRWIIAVVGLIVVIGLAVGLGVGLTRSSSSSASDDDTPTPTTTIVSSLPSYYGALDITSRGGAVAVSLVVRNQMAAADYDLSITTLPTLVVAGGQLVLSLVLTPAEAVANMTQLRLWFDAENATDSYRIDQIQSDLFDAVTSSELRLSIADLASGVHTLFCTARLNGSDEETFVSQDLYLVQPLIAVNAFRVDSGNLAVGGSLLVQINTTMPVQYVTSTQLFDVFQTNDSFTGGSLSSIDTVSFGSGEFERLFSQEFSIIAPTLPTVDGTEGFKIIQVQLIASAFRGDSFEYDEATSLRFTTITIGFFFTLQPPSPLVSTYGVANRLSLPAALNDADDAASVNLTSLPTVIGAEPIGILTGEVAYLNLTIQGTISDEYTLLIGFEERSGYLEFSIANLFNHSAEIAANATAAAGIASSNATVSAFARSRIAAATDDQVVHQLLVPVASRKADASDVTVSSGTLLSGVRSSSTGVVTPYHRSAASVSPPASFGQLHARLSWQGLTDVDLHAVLPGGEEIYYAHPTAGTGSLDVDSNADCRFDFINVENIYWTKPTSGEYVFSAVMYKDCDNGQSPVVLTVDGCDVHNEVRTGTVAPTLELRLDITCEHTYTITGHILYQAHDGLNSGAMVLRPASGGAKITVSESDTETVVGEGVIKDDGSYELRLTIATDHDAEEHVVEITTETSTFIVQDYDGDVHKLECALCRFTPRAFADADSGAAVLINLDLLFEFDDKSGALNILSVLPLGFEWYRGYGFTLPQTVVYWDLGVAAPGAGASNSRSFTLMGALYIGGHPDDPDEFDESVLLHEFAHRFHTVYGPPLTGGRHGGVARIRPSLAFSEGVATYFGQRQLQRQLYVDLSSRSDFRYSVCDASKWLPSTSTGLSTGRISEVLNICLLWRMQERGLEPAFLSHFRSTLLQPRYQQKGEVARADLADVVAFIGCGLATPVGNDFRQLVSQVPFSLTWFNETGFCVFA